MWTRLAQTPAVSPGEVQPWLSVAALRLFPVVSGSSLTGWLGVCPMGPCVCSARLRHDAQRRDTTAVMTLVADEPVEAEDMASPGGSAAAAVPCSAPRSAGQRGRREPGLGAGDLLIDRCLEPGQRRGRGAAVQHGRGSLPGGLRLPQPGAGARPRRGGTTTWPGYGPAAHEHGVRAVFAFPLQVGCRPARCPGRLPGPAGCLVGVRHCPGR